jgi:hypothetical protein
MNKFCSTLHIDKLHYCSIPQLLRNNALMPKGFETEEGKKKAQQREKEAASTSSTINSSCWTATKRAANTRTNTSKSRLWMRKWGANTA